jgi:histidinol-phosphate aminotransferase
VSYTYEKVTTPAAGLRLHLNENTEGCSPAVIAALRGLTRTQASFYPDYDEVTSACARRLGVGADRVVLTNGLDEGILVASLATLRRDHGPTPPEAIIVVPAFDMYAAYADVAGGRVIEVPAGPDFAFPLDAVLAAIGERTRLIWLTNPNNPSGQIIPRRDILAIAAAAPRALVVVDEAYADFSGETLLEGNDLDRLPNLVVGRTFAKAYGLAALRVGALVASPPTLEPMRRIVPPYSLNICAALALPAALADTEYFAWYLDEVTQSKALLYGAFERLKVPYWKSAANFVLARVGPDATRVVRQLESRGVFVRDKSGDPACAGCIRVTAGVVAHTQTAIDAIEEVLCGAA